MESALIVSRTEKSIAYFSEMLRAASCGHISVLQSCGEARRLIVRRSFDLVIINAPLRDESGELLSRHIASRGISQVILVVAREYFDSVSSICENDGVLTIARPINKEVFWSALKLAQAAQHKLAHVQAENSRLKQKIEDIRIIDRAKYRLITCLDIDEQDAHRHIEKRAMDMRITKRAVAEEILKTYGS